MSIVLSAALAGCGPKAEHAADEAAYWRAPDPFALADDSCDGAVAEAGRVAVNAVRAAAGARAFECLDTLARMASAHASYLALNDAGTLSDRHREEPGRPGFTGVTLAARAAAKSLEHDAFWLSEGVGGTGAPAAVVAAHVATVYHRSHLVTPGGLYFAYAEAQGRAQQAVMNSLAWVDVAGLAPLVYPGGGQRGVPTRFGSARETPDPVPDLAAPGFPISVHFPRYLETATGEEPLAEVGELSLTGPAGTPVDAVLIAPASDPALARGDAYLVPRGPLDYDTEYEATASVRYGDLALSRRWRFHTAGEGR